MLSKERLDEALEVTPLAQVDSRLDQPSKISLASSRLKRAKVKGPMHIQSIPPVHSQLRTEALEASPPAPAPPEKQGTQAEIPPEEITPEDMPEQAPEQAPEQPEQELPAGMPSGSGYNVQMAKGQLDGIIKNWMDMAGNYPEGEQRHNFLEIGERLREISAVLNRDFLGGGEGV